MAKRTGESRHSQHLLYQIMHLRSCDSPGRGMNKVKKAHKATSGHVNVGKPQLMSCFCASAMSALSHVSRERMVPAWECGCGVTALETSQADGARRYPPVHEAVPELSDSSLPMKSSNNTCSVHHPNRLEQEVQMLPLQLHAVSINIYQYAAVTRLRRRAGSKEELWQSCRRVYITRVWMSESGLLTRNPVKHRVGGRGGGSLKRSTNSPNLTLAPHKSRTAVRVQRYKLQKTQKQNLSCSVPFYTTRRYHCRASASEWMK